jgi:AraC family transcriptional regulator of adaptative response/methylated-DNA-[protein]-cysteine methyltransferase
VEDACRRLESAETPPDLASLAAGSGLGPHHFHRVFAAHTGLTPKAYLEAARSRRATNALARGETVTEAAQASAFASLSRFHDRAAARFGMMPSAVRRGGFGEIIVAAQAPGPLAMVTVAFSRRGVAAVRLTDGAQDGMGELVALYRHAVLLPGGPEFDALLAEVVAAIEEPARAAELPLDIRGTAFEERVWAALRRIPVGTTATYGEIAAALGRPTAHRAVARACSANPAAILVPCHRVVRADGSLAGYRWGVSRKRALLEVERGHVGASGTKG